jgi:hypothetical protein
LAAYHFLAPNVSLRDKTIAQKASIMFSPYSPHFSDHFHLLLFIVVMCNWGVIKLWTSIIF